MIKIVLDVMYVIRSTLKRININNKTAFCSLYYKMKDNED